MILEVVDTDNDGTTDNNATLDFGNKTYICSLFDDGTNETLQQNGTDYTTQDSLLLQLPPQTETSVKVYYNTEIITSSPGSGLEQSPDNRTLAAAGTATNVGIAIDGSNYDYVDIQYIH